LKLTLRIRQSVHNCIGWTFYAHRISSERIKKKAHPEQQSKQGFVHTSIDI